MNGQKLDDSEAHLTEDDVQSGDQISECPRLWDDHVACGIKLFDRLRGGGVVRDGAELSHESGIDRVGAAASGRLDLDDQVSPGGPHGLVGRGGKKEGLCLKRTNLVEGAINGPCFLIG